MKTRLNPDLANKMGIVSVNLFNEINDRYCGKYTNLIYSREETEKRLIQDFVNDEKIRKILSEEQSGIERLEAKLNVSYIENVIRFDITFTINAMAVTYYREGWYVNV